MGIRGHFSCSASHNRRLDEKMKLFSMAQKVSFFALLPRDHSRHRSIKVHTSTRPNRWPLRAQSATRDHNSSSVDRHWRTKCKIQCKLARDAIAYTIITPSVRILLAFLMTTARPVRKRNQCTVVRAIHAMKHSTTFCGRKKLTVTRTPQCIKQS